MSQQHRVDGSFGEEVLALRVAPVVIDRDFYAKRCWSDPV